MPDPIDSPYRVPFDGSFRVADAPTAPPEKGPGKKRCKRELADEVEELRRLQAMLYAHDHHSVLCVFQAMDAAGKDGTIRAVLSGVNPAGCQVVSFKQPSRTELDHDFLWRTTKALPERGRIGIFNRSHYEEVLVVRVHPEYLDGQQLPDRPETLAELWEERYASIREHERHLARNGTLILKFWLNVSQREQHRRFLARLDEPEKRWKFSPGDVEESRRWPAYMAAYEDALNATSRPWAPWFAIPADDKPTMRLTVARLLRRALEGLDMRFPEPGPSELARFEELGKELRRSVGR